MIRGSIACIIGVTFLLAFAASSTQGLDYAPGYTDFTYLLNGSWLIAPAFVTFGADKWTPFIAETAMWNENYTGKAVVLPQMIYGRSPEATIKKVLKEGAAKGYGRPSAIFSPSPAGIAGFGLIARDYSEMHWLRIPTVDISQGIYLLAKGLSDSGYPVKLAFVVRDDDRNAVGNGWSFSSVIITAAILASLCLACFTVNIYKFQLHIRYTSGLTTAKIFFMIDLVANLMRFWFVAVNPFFLSGFDYTWTTICSATHVPLSMICTLLLALKWRELLLKTKLKVTLFLTTFKWPFLIIASCLFLLEFIASALRGHWYNSTKITQVSISILIVNAFVIATLLFISGIQILVHLNRAVGSKRRIWTLSRTTFLILFSGLGILLWAIFQIAYLVKIYAIQKATIFFAQMITIMGFVALLIASLLQNWAMPFPLAAMGADTAGKTSVRSSAPHSVQITASRTINSLNPSDTNPRTEDDEDDDSDEQEALHDLSDEDDNRNNDEESRPSTTDESSTTSSSDDEESESASASINFRNTSKKNGKKESTTSSESRSD